jgi:copper chaperone
MESAILKVKGMSCEHCKTFITTIVGGIKGARVVDVDLENKTVSVEYDTDKINIGFIRAAIEDKGYEVVR